MTSFLKFIMWMASVRLSRILIFVFCTLVMVPLIVHYYLYKVEQDAAFTHHSHSTLDILEDFSALKASELKYRISEMLRMKASVSNELRTLESKSQKLKNEITSYHQKIEQLKLEMIKQQSDLNRLKISVQQAQLSHLEALQHNSPELAPPLTLLPSKLPAEEKPSEHKLSCHRMRDCFDYSRCSLTSGFPVFLYDTEEFFPSWDVPVYLKTLVHQTISYNPHFTKNPLIACVYLILSGESHNFNATYFKNLPYWGGDGRNHIILNLSSKKFNSSERVRPSAITGRAIIAQSSWGTTDYRQGHDIVIPPVVGPPGGETWMESPYMLPARRKYLLSFQGYASDSSMSAKNSFDASQIRFIHQHLTMATSDEFYMDFDCVSSSKRKVVPDEWRLCKTENDRASILKKSTFALIPCTIDEKLASTPVFLLRLFESLKYGAIPVILGVDQVELPFDEVIDWRKAAIMIPLSRISELHWLLRSIPDNDLLLMRRQGRILYDKYFATGQSVIDTILGVVRNRLLIPPRPIPDESATSVFPDNFKPLKMDPVVAETEPEENLGPLEPPFDSPKFKRNFSILFDQNYELWNDWGDPFHLYPNLPFDPLLPSDAKFVGSGIGFRAINGGAGGAGKEFCESLGGNTPKEQFTIVILTYEREQVLINSLSRLHGLPYLNKVVVVWNSPSKPSSDLRWPDIAVPIHVIAARKNSLNNRFLPYDIIETEAVLSVDDDAHLRHDEIIFGFRVWREQRDRIVGFPGRYHALDLNYGGWLYNSNYSCELSMVLTGAAFVHKYYLYMYTYYLPQAIRDMVDQYMNCEDIAMNFLVSHITQKPPVKVTSRWTFRCPGCPVSLSEEETHFNERHHCINFFTKVFGYTPLLNTQFRVDSILFKTRIPHDKQKCFKFI